MKIVCQLSGGYDSVAALIKLVNEGNEIYPLFIDYGQPYRDQELKAVQYVMDFYKDNPRVKDLKIMRMDIELQKKNGNTVSDYIPVRNVVLGALSANYAIANGIHTIAVGNKTTKVREDDPWSFADCSFDFYQMLSNTITFAAESGDKIEFIMPLLKNRDEAMTKAEVVKTIFDAGMDITKLWSCYQPGKKPCGICYHCQENKKAFKEAGIKDPNQYFEE